MVKIKVGDYDYWVFGDYHYIKIYGLDLSVNVGQRVSFEKYKKAFYNGEVSKVTDEYVEVYIY